MKWTKYISLVIIFSCIHLSATLKDKNETMNEFCPENSGSSANKNYQQGQVSKFVEKVLNLNNARIGNSGQIVLVTNKNLSSKDATVQTLEKVNGQWVVKVAKITATVGKNGFAPYKKKIENDGTTPTGVFFLGPVYSYPDAKVSTKMENWVASKNDYWIDDVKSKQYNRWVTGDIDPNTNNVSREDMQRKDDKYKYGIAVQYNMDQVKGKGSVITVHVLIGSDATAGCVAIPETRLIDIIKWLDPAKKPLIICGTEEELLRGPVSESTLDKNDKYIWKKEKYIPPVK